MSLSPVTLLQRHWFEPILKPGYIVRVEPLSKYGYFRMPKSAVPEPLPWIRVNLATPFTTALTKLSDTGQQTSLRVKKTELDLNTLTLGQYRLAAFDPAILFEIAQPSAYGRLVNKAGPVSFDWSNTMYHVINQNWSQLPEVWIFEDQTPLTLKATNMDMDADTYQARFIAGGWKYPLEPYGAKETDPALTITVEAMK